MLKVVVVDDDTATGILLSRLYAHFGVEVAGIAKDGVEGLAMIQRLRPDFVMLDQRLPKMTGCEVLRALRMLPDFAALPVFMLTAHGEVAIRNQAIESGATGFYVKPFDPIILVKEIISAFASAE